MRKRLTALLLALVMCLSLVPTVAFADERDNQVRVIVENTTFTEATEDSEGVEPAWSGMLVDKWVAIDNDSTMMSCVVKALGSYTQTGAESGYISEINGLAAFDGGSMSGWMGTLNDWFTNEGFGAFTVKDGKLSAGDEIRIMYTCDWGNDIGSDFYNNDTSLKALIVSAGTLDKPFAPEETAYTLTVPTGTENITVTPTAANKNFRVCTTVGETEYKRTAAVPVENGTVITVKCGTPEAFSDATTYTLTVQMEQPVLTPPVLESVKVDKGAPAFWPYTDASFTLTPTADSQYLILDSNIASKAKFSYKITVTADGCDISYQYKYGSNAPTVSLESGVTSKALVADKLILGDVIGTITLTDKNNPANKTVYTLRTPFSTTAALKSMTVAPTDRGLYAATVGDYAEGAILQLGTDGQPNGTAKIAATVKNYQTSFFGDVESFSLTAAADAGGYVTAQIEEGKRLYPTNGVFSGLTFGDTDTLDVALYITSQANYEANLALNKTGEELYTADATYRLKVVRSNEKPLVILGAEVENGLLYSAFDPALTTASGILAYGKDGVLKLTADDSQTLWVGEQRQMLQDGVYCVPVSEGTTTVTVKSATAQNSYTFTFDRMAENSPNHVRDYLCLAGQYANGVAGYGGYQYGVMPERTLKGEAVAGPGNMISLGNFGGYVVYEFEDPITNSANHPYGVDFYVYGNSNGGAGFSEPGSVLVSQDGVKWYELAGAAHYDDNAIWGYTMTYTRSADGKANWTDDRGHSGTSFNYPVWSYYPLVNRTAEMENSITVSGTLLVQEGTDDYGSTTAAYPAWGYTDTGHASNNPYGEAHGGENFDISWAVDEKGAPVALDFIRFVRIQTASNIVNGAIGEKSTEVCAVLRADAAASDVGRTAPPTAVTINGEAVNMEAGGNKFNAYLEDFSGALSVNVTAADNANVYINSYRNTTHTYATMPGKHIVRVVVQEGEKEPWIGYITLVLNRVLTDAVISAIDSIGEVTLASNEKIAAARTAYNALTDELKAKVTNYSVLTAAESAYANIVRTKARDIHTAVGDSLLENAEKSTPVVNSIGGEWMILGLARSGKLTDDVAAKYYDNVVETVKQAKGVLDSRKYTEYSRVVLALTAAGYDPTDVAGYDLTAPLTDFGKTVWQGNNGAAFGLIALNSHNYQSTNTEIRQQYIDRLLSKQLENGGWYITFGNADLDMTAMAIQALAPYYATNDSVKTAVDKALAFLSENQGADGDYGSSETCAQVVVALSALGIDAAADSRFVKNGTSVLEALCSYYAEDATYGKGFAHVKENSGSYVGGAYNGMATEQGYYALTAYERFKAAQNTLYNMSDVTHLHSFAATLSFDASGHWYACKDAACAVTLDKKSHTPVADAAVASTCTKTGLTAGSHCADCSYVITAQTTTEKKAHTYDNGKVTKAATCTVDGVMTFTCTVCGDSYTEPIPVGDHTYGPWETVKAASYTEEGLRKHTCTVCGQEETAVIPKRVHTNTSVQTGDSTVKDATSPRTADNGVVLYAAMSVMSLMGMGWVGKRRSK